MLAPAQQSLNIICCSSNIGNTQIHSKDLAAWLPVNGRVVGDDMGGQYDIIAVGMQEVGLSFSFLSLFPILFFIRGARMARMVYIVVYESARRRMNTTVVLFCV